MGIIEIIQKEIKTWEMLRDRAIEINNKWREKGGDEDLISNQNIISMNNKVLAAKANLEATKQLYNIK